jgi:hypothetical protein
MLKTDNPTRIISPFLAALLTIGIFLKTGWNLFPNFQYLFQLSTNFPSLPNIDSLAQYNFYSLAPYVLFTELGLGTSQLTKPLFFLLIVLCVLYSFKVAGNSEQHKFVFPIFICSPALMVLLSWVGSYDVFTIGAFLIVLYTRRVELAIFAGVVVAWSNYEQFILAGLILLVAIDINSGTRVRQMVVAGISSTIAYLFLRLYLYSQGVSEIRATGQMKLFNNPDYFANALSSAPFVFLTVISGSLVVLYFWFTLTSPTYIQIIRLIISIVLVLGTAMIALDQTRIGAILLLPVTLLLGEVISSKSSLQQAKKIFFSMFTVAILTPSLFVWSYELHLVGWGNLLLK